MQVDEYASKYILDNILANKQAKKKKKLERIENTRRTKQKTNFKL